MSTSSSTSSKCLFNNPNTTVNEAIHGYLLTRPDLILLAGLPSIRVIGRRTIDRNKIALVSGGGAGHEPAHGGLVGEGLLTAAVSGDIFASPHVKAIVAALHHIGKTEAGTLLIIKNYTGDRLAFGLAAETARADGYKVGIVFVADDAAIDGGSVTGRRGIAGTVFLHKILGYYAEYFSHQYTLPNLEKFGNIISKHVITMGASLSVCSIPGVPLSTRLSSMDTMEIGLGIHGEPGMETITMITANELAQRLIHQLRLRYYEINPSTALTTVPCTLLINNLGGLSNIEISIFLYSTIRSLYTLYTEFTNGSSSPALPIFVPQYVYTAPLMTSLDMKGLSLTILPHAQIEQEINTYLTQIHPSIPSVKITEALEKVPPTCSHWPACVKLPDFMATPSVEELFAGHMHPLPSTFVEKYSSSLPERSSESTVPSLCASTNVSVGVTSATNPFVFSTATVQKAMDKVYEALRNNETELSRMDSIAGDGDAGLTMRTIGEICSTSIQRYTNSTVSLVMLLGLFAEQISLVAGGSSGILYALILRAVQNYAQEAERRNNPNIERYTILRECLRAGIQAGSHYGGAKQGDRTMLDSLYGLLEYMDQHPHEYNVHDLIGAVETGADRTKDMVPKAGRASYVDPKICSGHRDAGAHAVAVWVRALASFNWE